MVVHTVLPERLTAAGDPEAVALVGPYRSADVAVQGATLGGGRDVCVALPTPPSDRFAPADLFAGVERAGQRLWRARDGWTLEPDQAI